MYGEFCGVLGAGGVGRGHECLGQVCKRRSRENVGVHVWEACACGGMCVVSDAMRIRSVQAVTWDECVRRLQA